MMVMKHTYILAPPATLWMTVKLSFLSYNGQIFLTSRYINVTALRNHVTFTKITSSIEPKRFVC